MLGIKTRTVWPPGWSIWKKMDGFTGRLWNAPKMVRKIIISRCLI